MIRNVGLSLQRQTFCIMRAGAGQGAPVSDPMASTPTASEASRWNPCDPPPHPHGQEQMARALQKLLESAREAGPYVLIGHSMGGANVRWFLQQNPEAVAGMVLVDAATAQSFLHNLAKVSESEAAEFWPTVRRLEGLERDSLISGYEELKLERTLGSKPLAILTASNPEAELPERRKWQGALAALSSNSVH